MSISRRIKRFFIDGAIILAATLILAELVLRLLGFTPFQVQPFSIVSKPTGNLIPSAAYGFALEPGAYEVTMNQGLRYTCKHTKDSLRYSGEGGEEFRMDIHGCSFAYGMGISDSLVFAYLLQQRFETWQINNYATPGYGTSQALLRLRQQVTNDNLPNMVLLAFAGFHEERNALNQTYRQHLYYGFAEMDENIRTTYERSVFRFPYGKYNDGNLTIKHESWHDLYKPFILREYSALTNRLQESWDKYLDKSKKKDLVTLSIIKEIKSICDKHNIQLVVANITDSDQGEELLAQVSIAGIKTLDIAQNISNDSRLNNAPYDSHPNATAHQNYADWITEYLVSLK